MFATCFPERLICLEYEQAAAKARLAKKQALQREAQDARAFATWEEHQSAKYGVEWQADKDVKACSLCAQSFTLFNRKHHCRSCGRVVCNACSRARKVPPRGAQQPKRACDRCAHGVWADEVEEVDQEQGEDTTVGEGVPMPRPSSN